MNIGIYAIKNLSNGLVYIGSSINIPIRWRNHTYRLNKGNHDNNHLQRAWEKYGEKSFAFIVLERCENLKEREQFWIDSFQALNPEFGYNLSHVTDRTRVSDQTRSKMSASASTRRGWKHSQATKEKMRLSKIGKKTGKRKTPITNRGLLKGKPMVPVIRCSMDGTQIDKFESITQAARLFGKSAHSNIIAVCKGRKNSAFKYKWSYANQNNN